jgi:hypothetical protein
MPGNRRTLIRAEPAGGREQRSPAWPPTFLETVVEAETLASFGGVAGDFPEVHGVGWIHDGSAPSRNKLAFGHRGRRRGRRAALVPVPTVVPAGALPAVAGKGTASTVDLAVQLVMTIVVRAPDRRVHVVADAAYHGKGLRDCRLTSPGRPGCPATPCCTTGPRHPPGNWAGHD